MKDPEFLAALASEGPATFVTVGPDGPHLVSTWQSYLLVVDAETLALPAAGYRITERNLLAGSPIQMVVGSRTGTSSLGFRLHGRGELQTGTPIHAQVKARFPWCRAALVFRVTALERILG